MPNLHVAAALLTSLLWSGSVLAQDTCESLRKEYEVLKTDGKALKEMTGPHALKRSLMRKHNGDRKAAMRAYRKLRKNRRSTKLSPEAQTAVRAYNERRLGLRARAKAAQAKHEPPTTDKDHRAVDCFARLQVAEPLFELRGLLRDLKKIDAADAAFDAIDQPVSDPSSWDERKIAFRDGAWDRLHPSRFVFLAKTQKLKSTRSRGARPLFKGEALMVIGITSNPGSRGGRLAEVVAVDGTRRELPLSLLRLKPLASSKRPPLRSDHLELRRDGKVVGGPGDFELLKKGHRLKWLRFNPLMDEDRPADRKFIAAQEKVIACYERQMERLDPDNRRNYFDLVTYGKGTPKVQSLAAAYDRKACRKCGCKKFYKRRQKFARRVITPLQKKRFAEEVKPRLDRTDARIAAWYVKK